MWRPSGHAEGADRTDRGASFLARRLRERCHACMRTQLFWTFFDFSSVLSACDEPSPVPAEYVAPLARHANLLDVDLAQTQMLVREGQWYDGHPDEVYLL